MALCAFPSRPESSAHFHTLPSLPCELFNLILDKLVVLHSHLPLQAPATTDKLLSCPTVPPEIRSLLLSGKFVSEAARVLPTLVALKTAKQLRGRAGLHALCPPRDALASAADVAAPWVRSLDLTGLELCRCSEEGDEETNAKAADSTAATQAFVLRGNAGMLANAFPHVPQQNGHRDAGNALADVVFLGSFLFRCTNLLALAMPPVAADYLLASAAASLNSLQTLHLHDSDVSDEGLLALSSLQALATLDLSGSSQFYGPGLRYLHPLRRLRTLRLSCCLGLTDEGVLLASRIRGLTDLDLSGCPMVTDAGLAGLVGLKYLTRLNLAACDGLTNEGLYRAAVLLESRGDRWFRSWWALEEEESDGSGDEEYVPAHLAWLGNLS